MAGDRVSSPKPWRVELTEYLSPHSQVFLEYALLRFRQEMQEPVEFAIRNRYDTEPLPSMGSRTVLMLSEGSSLATGDPKQHAYHLKNYEVLMVFMEMPWCLFGKAGSSVMTQKNIMKWLLQLKRPVRIGLATPRGKPLLWIHALTINARLAANAELKIEPWIYNNSMDLEEAFDNGADLALGRCTHALGASDRVRLLASAQKKSLPYLPEGLPEFTDLGLPPLERGWYGAFVPHTMRAADKHKLQGVLERMSQAPETAQMIERIGQVPLRMTTERSKQYISDYVRTWQSVAQLLDLSDPARSFGPWLLQPSQ